MWNIARFTATDIDAVSEIERLCFPTPWRAGSFTEELSRKDAFDWIVKTRGLANDHEEAVIAYICSRLILHEIYILKIAVAPKWQRQGIATWLLDNSFALACQVGADTAILDVRPSNGPAIQFYKKIGFQTVGLRPNYYPETSEDALIMKKRLKEET